MDSSSPTIDRRLTLVFAVAAGVAVANLYYAQPLLPSMAADLDASTAAAGLVVTVSQLGYAAGLAFVVPLGDLADRRRLVPGVLAGTAVVLAAVAAAPAIGPLILLAGVVGLGSVVAQIVVPLAAELAPDDERGRVVGIVMSGLLVGILTGRTAAGLIASVAGWRAVYLAGAAVTLALGLGLRRELPADRPRPRIPYRTLLRSVVSLVRTEPVLRRRCLYGAIGFAAFTAFWTSAAFLLAGPPYRYGEAVIGLFGLVGAAGALTASGAGRLADAGRTRPATGLFALGVAGSFALLAAGRHSLAALMAGILVLDVGATGLHVLNQSMVFSLSGDARSRLNAAYMTSFFLGGSAGSAASATLYSAYGWSGVCLLGAGLGAAALLVWVVDPDRPVSRTRGGGGEARAPGPRPT